MKQKILLILIIALQIFVLSQWTHCRDFSDTFHFSSFDLQLRLLDAIHSDQHVPLMLVRFFHNKAIGVVFDLFSAYVQFWSVSFLAGFISLAGIVGLGAQFYQFFSTKKKHVLVWICFAAVILALFIEIVHLSSVPFGARLFALWLPFMLWSTLGWWYLLKEAKINSKIVDVILIASVWYHLSLPVLPLFCIIG